MKIRDSSRLRRGVVGLALTVAAIVAPTAQAVLSEGTGVQKESMPQPTAQGVLGAEHTALGADQVGRGEAPVPKQTRTMDGPYPTRLDRQVAEITAVDSNSPYATRWNRETGEIVSSPSFRKSHLDRIDQAAAKDSVFAEAASDLGFRWKDAAIGAGMAVAAGLLLAVAALGARKRRTFATS